MANALNDTLHNEPPKLALRDSKLSPMTHITGNTLDGFSNSDNQSNQIHNPTGIILPPSFIQNDHLVLTKWHD